MQCVSCVHSDFLCLITPHIYGGGDDETDFATALVKSAFHRPVGFSPPEIEIHTEAPDSPASTDYAQRVARCVHNISSSLQSVIPAGRHVQLVLWPRLLDRYLIACVNKTLSGGKQVRSPRWGISMPHIARATDARQATPDTTWTLTPRVQLGDVFTRYCTGSPSSCVHVSQING
jgi:hypothetical protein